MTAKSKEIIEALFDLADTLDDDEQVKTVTNAINKIHELELKQEEQRKQLEEASWRLNPDRMGGQFDATELSRDEWGNYR